MNTNNIQIFFALVKAGLWEEAAPFSSFDGVDYDCIFRLAEEQSVVGLVSAGIEHVQGVIIPQEKILTLVGSTLQIEQRNKEMNDYVAKLIEMLRKEDVYALLVKGQGVAQCYERPLWRAAGDVDLLLSEGNYDKAKQLLVPQAVSVEPEYRELKHIGMTMKNGFVIELHGTLHSRLSKRVDNGIDAAQKDVFYAGNVRGWQNGKIQVFLPGENDDVIFLFAHILHHYYIEGIGLRQICDWCRFLWTYRNKLKIDLLKHHLHKMGLMSEWKAFAAVAVDWLGMPVDAMPYYSPRKKWTRKAKRIIAFVLETGNFGHNRQRRSGKIISVWRKIKDFAQHICVFPLDSIIFFFHFVGDGIKVATSE